MQAINNTSENHTHFPISLTATWIVLILWWIFAKFRVNVSIPKYGSNIPFLNTWSAIKFMADSRDILLNSYQNFDMFKVPRLDGWLVIVRGKLADEVRRAPETVLSLTEAVKSSLHLPYTVGRAITDNPWHENLVRTKLSSSKILDSLFLDTNDEICCALDEEMIGNSEEEWTTLNATNSLMRVVSRVTNRAFVGLDLCRNPAWRDLNVDYTVEVSMMGMFINLFPSWFHPIIGRIVAKFSRKQAHAQKLIKPLIEERMSTPPAERPNDMLSWLMKVAPKEEMELKMLTKRILVLNFAAIHTTSISLTHAVYWLLARPEYIEPLRKEVEAVISQYGWTREGIEHMTKLDSFFKESMRINPLGGEILTRKVVKPFTFSNGVTLPVGTNLSTHLYGMHRDERIYENASHFDGFRFCGRTAGGEGGLCKGGKKSSLVSTSPQYMPFGHGRLACPGRFFAASEMKCIMAHLLISYDMKWDEQEIKKNKACGSQYRADDFWFGTACMPNRDAKIMIRRR